MKALFFPCLLAFVGCASSQRGLHTGTPARDPELFALAVGVFRADTVGAPIRVDPRPLKPDPELVTLHNIDVMPERINPDAQAGLLPDSVLTAQRRVTLVSMGIPMTDAIKDTQCPGGLLPPRTEQQRIRKEQLCPSTGYRSLILATPRKGAEYWPGNIDKRSEFGGANVVSIRAVQTSVGPGGSVQSSFDLVFERDAEDQWHFLRRTILFLVE